MRFANPLALWLLLGLPALVYLLTLGRRRHTEWLHLFGDRALLQQTPARFPALRRVWVSTCLITSVFVARL